MQLICNYGAKRCSRRGKGGNAADHRKLADMHKDFQQKHSVVAAEHTNFEDDHERLMNGISALVKAEKQ
jgi:hypothetical protein